MFAASLVICAFVINQIIIDTEAFQHSESFDVHNISGLSDKLCQERWQKQINVRGRNVEKYDKSNKIQAQKVLDRNYLKNLLVHVGKTGGTTIAAMLGLHKISFQQLHVRAVDSIMIDSFDTIILSLRDPIQRLISAYHFSHPLIPHSAANLKNQSVDTFYSCNPNLTTFADNLVLPTECGTVARNIGKNSSFAFTHIPLDTCSYLRGVFESLKKNRKKVNIVNQESLVEDLNKLSAKKRWNTVFRDPPHVNKLSIPTKISPLSYMKLAGYLELIGESGFYRILQREFGGSSSSSGTLSHRTSPG